MSSAVVCYRCHGPRTIERVIRPGETLYAVCSACGERGIWILNDGYVPPMLKKTNTLPYHRSPYRGGKLR